MIQVTVIFPTAIIYTLLGINPEVMEVLHIKWFDQCHVYPEKGHFKMSLNLQCGVGFPTTQLIRFIDVLVVYSSTIFFGDPTQTQISVIFKQEKNRSILTRAEYLTLLTEIGKYDRFSVTDAEQEGLNLRST